MPMTVEYAIKRGELWQWYWMTWRRRLWRFHLLLLVMVTAVSFLCAPKGTPTSNIVENAVVFGIAGIGFLIAYPQPLFKAEARRLTLTKEGLDTVIGRRSGKRTWSEIRSISDEGGYLIFTVKSGNAFLVPSRAFASGEARTSFVAFARKAVAT